MSRKVVNLTMNTMLSISDKEKYWQSKMSL